MWSLSLNKMLSKTIFTLFKASPAQCPCGIVLYALVALCCIPLLCICLYHNIKYILQWICHADIKTGAGLSHPFTGLLFEVTHSLFNCNSVISSDSLLILWILIDFHNEIIPSEDLLHNWVVSNLTQMFRNSIFIIQVQTLLDAVSSSYYNDYMIYVFIMPVHQVSF